MLAALFKRVGPTWNIKYEPRFRELPLQTCFVIYHGSACRPVLANSCFVAPRCWCSFCWFGSVRLHHCFPRASGHTGWCFFLPPAAWDRPEPPNRFSSVVYRESLFCQSIHNMSPDNSVRFDNRVGFCKTAHQAAARWTGSDGKTASKFKPMLLPPDVRLQFPN